MVSFLPIAWIFRRFSLFLLDTMCYLFLYWWLADAGGDLKDFSSSSMSHCQILRDIYSCLAMNVSCWTRGEHGVNVIGNVAVTLPKSGSQRADMKQLQPSVQSGGGRLFLMLLSCCVYNCH